jgi:hypothetical protein
VKKRRRKRGRKEIATKEKRRIKRVVAEKDNKNSDDSTQSINRAQHDNAPLFQSLTCTTSRYYLMPRIWTRIFGSATYEEKSDLENALLQHLKSLDIRVLVFSR